MFNDKKKLYFIIFFDWQHPKNFRFYDFSYLQFKSSARILFFFIRPYKQNSTFSSLYVHDLNLNLLYTAYYQHENARIACLIKNETAQEKDCVWNEKHEIVSAEHMFHTKNIHVSSLRSPEEIKCFI